MLRCQTGSDAASGRFRYLVPLNRSYRDHRCLPYWPDREALDNPPPGGRDRRRPHAAACCICRPRVLSDGGGAEARHRMKGRAATLIKRWWQSWRHDCRFLVPCGVSPDVTVLEEIRIFGGTPHHITFTLTLPDNSGAGLPSLDCRDECEAGIAFCGWAGRHSAVWFPRAQLRASGCAKGAHPGFPRPLARPGLTKVRDRQSGVRRGQARCRRGIDWGK